MNRIHALIALGLIALGLILMFNDVLAFHALERPLSWAALIIGAVWLVGRIGWWIVWKNGD